MTKIVCPACGGTGKCDAPEPGSLDARQIVFKAWAAGQLAPDRCRMGDAAVRLIDAALRNASADDICALFEYAYKADEPAARFWRGGNTASRRYLGLDTLLATSKLAGRVSEALAWRAKQSSTTIPGAPVMGDLAAFRLAPTWGPVPVGADPVTGQVKPCTCRDFGGDNPDCPRGLAIGNHVLSRSSGAMQPVTLPAPPTARVRRRED